VKHARLVIRDEVTAESTSCEQLLLAIEVPAAAPQLVATVEDADALPAKATGYAPWSNLAQLSEVLARVLEFHEAFDLPREPLPTAHVSDTLAQLRIRLLREEVEEFVDAVEARNLVAIADALADVVYVAYGSAVTYGVDLDAVVREVHRSNMSKLDSSGRPLMRADGKVLKPESYSPPNVGGLLDRQLPLFHPDGPLLTCGTMPSGAAVG
jgi:predicted HAD superfamily Cof-like phosphohydrolase